MQRDLAAQRERLDAMRRAGEVQDAKLRSTTDKYTAEQKRAATLEVRRTDDGGHVKMTNAWVSYRLTFSTAFLGGNGYLDG